MVEVFTTNVLEPVHAKRVLDDLKNSFSELELNFDLEGSERPLPCRHSILRAEGSEINPKNIISVVNQSGFNCEVLEDKICR